MLPLIPALLLLVLHGPSGLEKLSHEGRLPKALRVLERVWAPTESTPGGGKISNGLEDQKRALQTLAVLAADPDFSRALWSLFELNFELTEPSGLPLARAVFERRSPLKATHFRPADSLRDGFWQSRRTRAGPVA